MKYSRLDQRARALKIIKILEQATRGMVEPASSQIIAKYGRNPFLVLISCILSLRTKDTVSLPASIRLFEYGKTPQELLELSNIQIEKLIYPVGFYRRKAQTIRDVCKALLERFYGRTPDNFQDLVSLKGVGPKTANLVLGEGFNIPAICVDTHVHKVSNRLGLVKSKTPEETERQLKEVLPEEYWIAYNRLIVMWGQNICVPISPFCSKCAIADYCPRVGVVKSR